MTNLHITSGDRPEDLNIRLDDIDFGRLDTSLIVIEPGRPPVVRIKLDSADDININLDQANIRIDDTTRTLLVALGWTPPKVSARRVCAARAARSG